MANLFWDWQLTEIKPTIPSSCHAFWYAACIYDGMHTGVRMNQARKAITQQQRKPGDVVPESGIYAVLHSRCTSEVREATFVTGQQLPPCRICGARVRFQLKQAIPHIYEDRDFKA